MSEMQSRYTPWEELGITELEYWKQRYLEARAQGCDECLEWAKRYDDSVGFLQTRTANLVLEIEALEAKLAVAKEALELIAAPTRADGSYNRCREACELLAREALRKIEDFRGESEANSRKLGEGT